MATTTRLTTRKRVAQALDTHEDARRRTRQHRRSAPGRPGPINEWMELRCSQIHGLGVFARRDVPKGTRMIEYTGEKIGNAGKPIVATTTRR